MKAMFGVLGIAVLIAVLAVPVFARGPGWGRGRVITGNEPIGPGY